MEAYMKKAINKKMLALIISVAMSVSLFTLPVNAAADDGVGISPNTQLWYTDTEFVGEYEQTLDIDFGGGVATPTVFTLGDNTIQKFILDSIDGVPTYVISAHPQYFGTSSPPNYDDEATAQYIMHIDDILVLNPITGKYEKCFANGIARIPAMYALPKADPTYLQCVVYSSILNDDTGLEFDAAWNGAIMYLQIATDN
jgi:hypothetical protein